MLLTTCQCEDRQSWHSPHLSVYSYERRIQILDIVFLFPHSQALKTVVIEAHTHAETRKKRDKWITGWCCYFLLRPSFSLSFLHFFASSVCAHVLWRNLTGFPGIIFFFSFFLANWLVSVRPILPSHEPTNGLSVCLSVCSIVLLPACLVSLSSLSECELSYFWFFFFRTTSSRSPFPPLPSAGWLVVYRWVSSTETVTRKYLENKFRLKLLRWGKSSRSFQWLFIWLLLEKGGIKLESCLSLFSVLFEIVFALLHERWGK